MKVKSIYLIGIILLGGVFATSVVRGLTYQTEVDLEYTFVPTVRVSFDTNTGFVIEDLAPGTAAYSNTVTVTAGSNMADGYNLLASVGDSTDANRNNNRLVNADNVNYFESVAANANLELSALGENKWGYAVYDSVNSTWSNYNGLPAVSANNANDVTLTSANSAGSTDVVMKIGASATNSQASGEFTNNINFYITANVVTYNYSVTYNANNNSATNIPANVTNATFNTGEAVVVSATTPAAGEDQFLGWCDGTVSGSDCSGTLYQPGDYLKFLNASSSALNAKTLVGVWDVPARYMQDVASWGDDLSVGDEVIAVDNRDGKEYTVARLADGNIWMTQNLDFDIVDGGADLDSTNTDVPADWNDAGNLTDTYATDDGTWNGSPTEPESYDPGDVCWNGILDENWETTLSNGTTACGDDKHYHIGNYYNWTAAVAMNDSSSYTADNTDVNQSICPAGWRLPIGGTSNTGSKSFQYLVDQLSLTSGTSGNIQNSPVYFVYGGYWNGSSYGVGSDGFYWSSVVTNSYNAYYLYFNVSGSLYPQDYVNRFYGGSVRCVAR